MRLWRQEQLDAVSASLRRARGGEPIVLCVSGAAGSGKTSLLDELVERAGGFTVAAAEGVEGDPAPYRVMEQWGVPVGAVPAPFVVAQRMREMIDGLGRRPLLFRLDDLHWADPESVGALLWVLRRAGSERLLVAVGWRTGEDDRHPEWRRWLRQSRRAVEVELSGLTVAQVGELVATRGPDFPARLPELLHAHTGGNPLYVRAMLDEYEPAELAARAVLPAPAEFARTVAARTGRLSAPAAALLAATAVLGGGWQSLPDAAATAGVGDPLDAVQELADAGLLQVRPGAGADSVRPAHALVRSAVYQQLPLAERKRLHGRAAAVLADEVQALDHRLAGAGGYDDELADAAEAYALRLRTRQAWSQSARYLRAASALTAHGPRRRQRRLESVLDTVLIPDVPAARAELAAGPASDDPAERLVPALVDVFDQRYADGIAALERVLADLDDPVPRYRAGVMLAHAMFSSGAEPARVDEVLRAAETAGVADPVVYRYAAQVRAFLDEKLLDFAEQWATIDPGLGDARSVPVARTVELGRRAIVAVRVGRYDVAAADAGDLMRRYRDGLVGSFPEPVPDGLGYVQWLLGDWSAARVSLHLAEEMRGSSYLVHLLIGEGRLEEAWPRVQARIETHRRRPWASGRSNVLNLVVAHARATGDPGRMREAGTEMVAEVEALLDRPPTVLWLVSAGLATVWAGRAELASTCAKRLDAVRTVSPWTAAAASWVRGLAAGDADLLRAAAYDPALNLPYYRGHMLVDYARAARDGAAAQAALRAAGEIYQRLGAVVEAERVRALLEQAPPADRPAGPRVALTERERDVLALLGRGMSYAQIAEALFITQKTVGYHLSNMYGKAGVTSRHQLADLARREPDRFAVPVTAGGR